MAKAQDNIFGAETNSPKGVLFFFDLDTPNTQVKHPKNQYPSDKFDVTIGFPKTADLSKMKAACDKVAMEAFKTTDGIDMPFSNGDDKSMSSMKGYIVARAKSSKRPGLLDGNNARTTENEVKAGMWGKIQVTPMSYISGKTKGVTFVLKNVKVFTDLEYKALSGGVAAEDAFKDDDEDDGTHEPF